MYQPARRSGRTTRMLTEALEAAMSGQAVYIIASHRHTQEYMRELLAEMSPASDFGIKIEFPAPSNFDWESLTLLGAHQNCRVLVDHLAIEVKYARILDMLHRHDAPDSQSAP